MSTTVHILACVHPDSAGRYEDYLSAQERFAVRVVTDKDEAQGILTDAETPVDVLVIDNALGGVFELVRDLRQTYPRMLIVLVDEESDFSMPGRADDVSIDPFTDDDLIKRIHRLIQERQTETLRADSLPPVRAIAKRLRRASGASGKAEAAVTAIGELGYDFVAYYRLTRPDSPLVLSASAGAPAIKAIAPDEQKDSTLVGWVARNGQSRIVGPDDEPNYSLIKRGRLGAGICIPVGGADAFGVLLACREEPGTISQENALLLELIGAQLAAALARE